MTPGAITALAPMVAPCPTLTGRGVQSDAVLRVPSGFAARGAGSSSSIAPGQIIASSATDAPNTQA